MENPNDGPDNVIELAKLLNIQLIPVKMDKDGMLPDALDQICSQSSISGIYLMPSCNNPTTIHMPIERKLRLAGIIKKHNLVVLEDDYYAFATAGILKDYVAPMRELIPEQTVYICNTTNSICSGLRIAFLVFPYRYLDDIHSAICNINVKTSALDAEVICRLIESELAKEIASKKLELSKKANALFNESFPDNFQGHPYSFFRWLEIPKDKQYASIGWELFSRGVNVYHSRRFTCSNEENTSYLRIALSSTASEQELKDGLLKIKQHLYG